jgi:GT2 family glycosyltransferase
MKVTIIIVTFRSENVINACLSRINKSYPVIVVENSDNENFKKIIESQFSNVQCILTGKNIGFGKANNIGLRFAKTEYVLLLNPDSLVFENTIEILNFYAEYIKDFALLAPIITNENEPNYGFFNKKKIYLNTNNFFEVDYIKGFAMFFNKKKFSKINFFDENIFIYLEEIDLCKRLNYISEKIYLIPQAKIQHLGGKSHGEEFNLEMEISRNWHWMWSNFYYNKKHFGKFEAYRITIIIFLKSIFKMCFFKFFNKKKFFVHKARFLGLLNSYLGNKSFYRPFK